MSSSAFADLRHMRRSERRYSFRLIDGPNMSNLRTGGRDRRTYGSIPDIGTLHRNVVDLGEALNVEVSTFLSNHEGELIEYVHETAGTTDAYLINPAGLNLIGAALSEALAETAKPVIELHFANIAAIGYQTTLFTHSVTGMTMGLRQYGYYGSIIGLACLLDDKS